MPPSLGRAGVTVALAKLRDHKPAASFHNSQAGHAGRRRDIGVLQESLHDRVGIPGPCFRSVQKRPFSS